MFLSRAIKPSVCPLARCSRLARYLPLGAFDRARAERRNKLAQDIKALGENIGHGQQSLAQIHQSVETNLAVATHAETWSWKEVEANSPKKQK